MISRTVTLVDNQNNALGECDIIDAHTNGGKLHRAFSVFVFRNIRSELLIQRRALGKMLWPGIWANTCCSHPFPKESAIDAGRRRLNEELGFTCTLIESSSFMYRADDPNGKGTEHEYDTILIGDVDVITVQPNPDEVMEWKWVNVESLREDMKSKPDEYAPWFHLGLEKVLGNG